MKPELKPFWNNLFTFDWKFGLVLVLSVCLTRFILVLNANMSGNYGYISLIMIISAIAPFIFLSKYGRQKVGIKKPVNFGRLVYSFLVGIIISSLLFGLASLLYTDTFNNWYYYIGKSYKLAENLSSQDKQIYFIIYSVISMTFSPIGEELFFRGIVHESFAVKFGETKASIIDSSAFALTHLSHFGIVYLSGKWKFLPIPSILWVTGMFLTSIVFFQCKKYTDSILGAIICHAGFNLAMTYFIFYRL
jgi:uncharacterized protein